GHRIAVGRDEEARALAGRELVTRELAAHSRSLVAPAETAEKEAERRVRSERVLVAERRRLRADVHLDANRHDCRLDLGDDVRKADRPLGDRTLRVGRGSERSNDRLKARADQYKSSAEANRARQQGEPAP